MERQHTYLSTFVFPFKFSLICLEFNFQVSISPVVELPARCLNNGDHIPPQFPDNLPVVSYYYNNLVQQENLYYQEATEPRTLTPIQFTLTAK